MAADIRQEAQISIPEQSQPDAELTKQMREDQQETEQKLAATRSALEKEAAEQEEERKVSEEPETEPVKFYHVKDGHLLFTLQLPKGGKYTTTNVNQALRAAGINYTYSPAWTPDGWRMRGKDILAALKKAVQAIAPPEAQWPGQNAA